MRSPTLRILLIGDTARPEFHEAVAALEDLAGVARFLDVEMAIATLTNDDPPVGNALRGVPPAGPALRGVPPETRGPPSWNATEGVPYRRETTPSSSSEALRMAHGIVLIQAYPDQFPAAAIDRLRGLAPLARLIVVLGSWCEGEPRSGYPLPGAIRMYWHQAAVRIRREFPRWCQAEDSAWRLPVTASDEERLLAAIDAPLLRGDGLVAIGTRRPEMEALLSDACRKAGYATAWVHPRQPARVRGAAAAIYDGASLDAAGLAELTQLSAAVSPAPLLALLDAPRIQDVRLARTLGAAVLAKPFCIDELLWLLPCRNKAL